MPHGAPQPGLREIGHLFLSSVRQRQTGNAPRPQRLPPSTTTVGGAIRPSMPGDLSPDEPADAGGPASRAAAARATARGADREPIVTPAVLLASHLDADANARARDYAAHLAASAGGRVGLIEVGPNDLRLSVFERNPSGPVPPAAESHPACLDARRIAEAVDELAFDVDHWLVLAGTPRGPEARDLLRRVDRLVLLSTCDADGVVAAYRTLKGAADLMRRDASADLPAPRLTLAVLDAPDEALADAVHAKLAGVAAQFLGWPVRAEAPVRPTLDVAEHVILDGPCAGPAQAGAAHGVPANPAWSVIADLIDRSTEGVADDLSAAAASEMQPTTPGPSTAPTDAVDPRPHHRESPRPEPAEDFMNHPASAAAHATTLPGPAPMSAATPASPPIDDVIDLPGLADDAAAILSAVLAGTPQQWVECPVRPPMCDDARLAVSRDRSLTLLAVARRGLSDLRPIGQAYQWLTQNRGLVAMALPQLAIDAHAMPRLLLLVDHADLSADELQPLLRAGHVTVTAYRKLRWSGRTGLLLEAA